MTRFLPLALALFLSGAPAPARWKLVEAWRVGGEVEGPLSLGDVKGMGLLPNGNVVILDAKDQQLHILDGHGKPLRTVGRKGKGPGEFAGADGLVVLPNGTMVVHDQAVRRVTLFTVDGDLIKSVLITDISYTGVGWDAVATNTGLVKEYVYVRRGATAPSIGGRRTWSADFSRADTTYLTSCPSIPAPAAADSWFVVKSDRGILQMKVPYSGPRKSELYLADGSVWLGLRPDYVPLRHFPAGTCTPDATIAFKETRLRIPDVVRDSSVQRVRKSAEGNGGPMPDLERIGHQYPAFEAIFPGVNGEVWIERRSNPVDRRFDVFNARGALLAQVDRPAVLQQNRPFIVSSGMVYGFVVDSDDLPYLVAWRIVK